MSYMIRSSRLSMMVMAMIALITAIFTTFYSGTISFDMPFTNSLVQALIITVIMIIGTSAVYFSKISRDSLIDEIEDLKIQLNNIKKSSKKSKKKQIFEEDIKKQLYEDDDRMNIVKLSIMTEIELQRLVKKHNIKEDNLTLMNMIYLLLRKKVIDSLTYKYLMIMNEARNKAVHGKPISEKETKIFLDLADYVLYTLKEL